MPVMKVIGQLREERDMVRCWVEKLTKVMEYEGEALVKHQMEGIAEGWGELEEREE